MSIPYILHQSWKTTDIPHHIYPKAWVGSWREHHPEWQHILWTDEDNRSLVACQYPEFLPGYDAIPYGVRKADFCRFLYMHRYGGVYVDLDFVCLRNIEPLIGEGNAIVLGQLSAAATYYRIPNAFMASEQGNDFWLLCARDAIGASPAERERAETHTGPLRLEWALRKYRPQLTTIYPDYVLYPIDWHRTNPNFSFDGWANLKALALRGMTPADMAKSLPGSFAVTFWSHNW
jgi:mannosyltransferase OCH1-like enzyme